MREKNELNCNLLNRECSTLISRDAAQVLKGSTFLVTQNVVNYIIGAVTFPFIVRALTKTEIGVTVGFFLVLGLADILSDVGFGRGLAKYIAEYRGKGEDYTSLIQIGVFIKVLIATIIAVICIFIAPQISLTLLKTREYTMFFQLLSLDLIFVCLTTTMRNILLGLNKIEQMATLDILAKVVQRSIALTLLFIGWGLTGWVTGWIIGDFAYVTISMLLVSKGKHLKIHPLKGVSKDIKLLVKFSWPLFLSNAADFLYNWFDRIFLLACIPLTEVAVYNVALTAYGFLIALPGALTTTLLPYYGEQYGKNQHEILIPESMFKVSRYIALLYTPLALGLMSTAHSTMILFAGAQYASGDIVLAILCLFSLTVIISTAFGPLLLIYKKTLAVLATNMVSMVVSLTMFLTTLNKLGAAGMAIIKGVSVLISFVLAFIILRKIIAIKIDKEALWKSLISGIAMTIIVKAVELTWPSMYMLPLYITVGGAVYLILLKVLKAIKEDDIKLVEEIFGQKISRLAILIL